MAKSPKAPASVPPPAPAGDNGGTTAVSGRREFSARLDTFQGPLDLLLYLIKENEVEITNIPIAQILQQYLQYMDQATQWDLHLAGEFLVMATTLMEIKSRELLPQQEVMEATPAEEIIEDPRSELVRQLLRYRKLKDQAHVLEMLEIANSQRRPRGLMDDIPEPEAIMPIDGPLEVEFSLFDLLTAFENVRKQVLAAAPRVMHYEGEPLDEKIARIEKILAERPFVRFIELVENSRTRSDIAMTFLALLELVRRRMIRLHQAGAFQPLEVKTQTLDEAEALTKEEAAAADDYDSRTSRAKAERAERLAALAEAEGVPADKLPWKTRREAMNKPKFDGIQRADDVEELDAEEAEIARKIEAILAAADAISQRVEDGRHGREFQPDPDAPKSDGAPETTIDTDAAQPAPEEEAPLTDEDLAPKPESDPNTP